MNKQDINILVVCHDAGGAEIVSAYVKKNLKKNRFVCLVVGPAEKIFKRKGLGRYLITDEKKAKNFLIKAKELITGTGWGSSIELDFIKEAKKNRVKSISYIDHWVNYRERFGYPRKDWENKLPDEIWVGDKYAYNLARSFFGNTRVTLVPNEYFKEIKRGYKEKVKKNKIKKSNGILLISEPFGSNVNSFGDKSHNTNTEFDVLNYILKYFAENNLDNKIIFRLHPAENRDKYDKLLLNFKRKLKIKKSDSQDIYSDLVQCSTVVGVESMALVVAFLCGKKVISFIPIKNKNCPLPFEGIFRIRDMSEIGDFITQ